MSESAFMVEDNWSGNIRNSYTDSQISDWDAGTVENSGILTGENVTLKSTYQGFDFDNIWQIEEGKTTPYLRGMEKPAGVNIN